MSDNITTKVVGIIGNTLYLHPIYGGDHIHRATIDKYTKDDLLERGIKEFSTFKEVEIAVWGLDCVKPKDYTHE